MQRERRQETEREGEGERESESGTKAKEVFFNPFVPFLHFSLNGAAVSLLNPDPTGDEKQQIVEEETFCTQHSTGRSFSTL